MNKYKYILLFFILTFILHADEECDFVREEVKDFLIEQRNSSDKNTVISKVDYVDITETYNTILEDIDANEGCGFITKDSLKIQLKYYHGIFTVKRVGDIGSLKKMMSSSQKIIEDKVLPSLIMFIKKSYKKDNTYLDELNELLDEAGNNKDEINKVKSLARDLYDYFSSFNKDKIIPEIEKLNKLYKDFNIFIDDSRFFEMQEFYDISTEKPIYINIEPPPIYYKKSKFKDKYKDQITRMDYLRKESIPLKLTSYDNDKGFYMKIPMLPVVQEDWETGPEYAYGITINGNKKYRVEFSLLNTENLNLSSDLLNMDSKSDVPYNWSKIYLPSDYSWKYYDERNDFEIASFNTSSGIVQNGYEDEFIAIEGDGKIIIYQKKNVEQSNYSIELEEKESRFPAWIKYLLFLTLFGAGYGQS